MTTEEFIRDCAKRGWSKAQTMGALDLNTNTFWAMLECLPDIVWAKRGTTLGNRQGNAARSKKASPKLEASLERARKARRAKSLYTWEGRTGTIIELAQFSPVSERTIFRRLEAGKSVEEAFGAPPNTTPPDAGMRVLARASRQRHRRAT